MKTFVPLLALAAGSSATFIKAPPFTCPANTDNKCTDQQKPGFSWDDLDLGDFFSYKDFHFSGWKCESDGGNVGGRFAPRTFKKVIGGTCSSEKKQSPSFGCGASVDKFSLGSIHVKPEFDCDLEFHYDMPDGSTCKHRSPCKKSGTTVVNKQCGGAKNVTIVYPPQPNKPKPSCSIQVPTISFDCSTASSTQPPKTRTSKAATTSTPAKTTATTSEVKETSTKTLGQPSSSSPAETGSSATPGSSSGSTPSQATSTAVSETTSETVAPTGETSTSPAGQSGSSSSETPATSSPVTQTITTSYVSTSTIFTTSTSTITQCAPTVTNCPAHSVVTTVVTVAVSTTVCPVTETLTTVVSTALPTTAGAATTTSKAAAGSSSAGTPSGAASSSAVVSSAKPVETLPCPNVVPSCLNTFLFSVGCSDNTDAACYCPDATFVKNVYDCLYAHGETDAVIAEAIAYIQGICGKWVNQNPAIATGATVTSYVTVTAAPTIAPVTTVVVDVTTVVPCTNEAGEVIPSSSTTVTVSTSMTVPQVGFTTGASGSVDVIPVTAAPAVTSGAAATGAATTPGSGSGSKTSVAVPTGTGSLRPSASTTGRPVVVGAGGRVDVSLGLAAAVALVAAVAL